VDTCLQAIVRNLIPGCLMSIWTL